MWEGKNNREELVFGHLPRMWGEVAGMKKRCGTRISKKRAGNSLKQTREED